MEKQSKNIDQITKNIMKDGGLHQPSSSFLTNVMEAIEEQQVSVPIVYKPLISRTKWFLLFTLSIVALILLAVFPVFSETPLFSQFTIPEGFNFEFSLPKMNLSKTTIYGFGFMALFLFQIPFLKRQLDKSYL